MAAGVTPEILRACPTERGLIVASFSLTSLERPLLFSYGMARSSSSRNLLASSSSLLI